MVLQFPKLRRGAGADVCHPGIVGDLLRCKRSARRRNASPHRTFAHLCPGILYAIAKAGGPLPERDPTHSSNRAAIGAGLQFVERSAKRRGTNAQTIARSPTMANPARHRGRRLAASVLREIRSCVPTSNRTFRDGFIAKGLFVSLILAPLPVADGFACSSKKNSSTK